MIYHNMNMVKIIGNYLFGNGLYHLSTVMTGRCSSRYINKAPELCGTSELGKFVNKI